MQIHVVALVFSLLFETSCWHQKGPPVFSVTAASTFVPPAWLLPQKDHVPGKDASVKCFDAVLGKVHLPCLRFIAVRNVLDVVSQHPLSLLCLWLFSALYHAGQNDYLPVFCFEGLFLNLVEITYRFPSLRAPFSSQVKSLKPVFFCRGAVFESGKNTILIHFLDFFACKYSTIQHTYSIHHTQHTTTHSIQDPQYISTAQHITSHDITSHHMTSPDITPHDIT